MSLPGNPRPWQLFASIFRYERIEHRPADADKCVHVERREAFDAAQGEAGTLEDAQVLDVFGDLMVDCQVAHMCNGPLGREPRVAALGDRAVDGRRRANDE